jgi:mitogen-activated protein kinase organizer 1
MIPDVALMYTFTALFHETEHCGSDKSVKLWNPHKNILLKTYCGHGYEVLDAQASCDNSQLCSCGMDKSVVLFDVATGNAVRKYRGHAGNFR